VRVRYEVLPHLASVEQAMAPDAPAVFPGGNTRQGTAEETGDIAAASRERRTSSKRRTRRT